MMRGNITADELRSLVSYNPDSGVFTRLKDSKRGAAKAGDVAGVKASSADGYCQFWVNGKKYNAHRLAWLYMTGAFPLQQVDHINGDKADNRWSNLRDVSNGENQQNIKFAKSHNKTGMLGVSKNKKKWKAEIRHNGVRVYIGTYDSPEQAHAAYIDRKNILHISGAAS